jgi:hypothetical protein
MMIDACCSRDVFVTRFKIIDNKAKVHRNALSGNPALLYQTPNSKQLKISSANEKNSRCSPEILLIGEDSRFASIDTQKLSHIQTFHDSKQFVSK